MKSTEHEVSWAAIPAIPATSSEKAEAPTSAQVEYCTQQKPSSCRTQALYLMFFFKKKIEK